MLGADEVIKAGGREAIFAPFLAKLFVPAETPTVKSTRLLNKSLAELDQNTEDRNFVANLKEKFRAAQVKGGLNVNEHEELRQLLNDQTKELDKNRNTIVEKINEEINKKKK
uniref:hypothetical protein n=1 Tax=Elmerina hispida TaxID=1245649 RepID=UPI003001C7F0|nr:hypothetical protein [Elmerina hispida]